MFTRKNTPIVRFALAGLFFFLQISAAGSPSAWEPGRFDELYDRFTKDQAVAPKPKRHLDKNINYVFVSGFMGEILPSYWRDQVKTLKTLLPNSKIYVIRPSSRKPIGGNREWLLNKLEQIPGTLVIIAHSKGAAEVVDCLAHHPDFAKNHVEDIYSVQGAFKGSALADAYRKGRLDPEVLEKMTFLDRFRLKLSFNVAAQLLAPLMHNTIISLSAKKTAEFWERSPIWEPKVYNIISPKLHFIVTSEDPKGVSWLYGPQSKYMQLATGKNDGVLATSAQKLDSIGNVIANMKALHGDFTNFASRYRSPKTRSAFFETLYSAVETKENLPHDLCPWALERSVQSGERRRVAGGR